MTKPHRYPLQLNVFTANICSDLLPTCRAAADLVTELHDEVKISAKNKKLVRLRHAVLGIEHYFSCLVNFAHIITQQPSSVLTHIDLPKTLKRLSGSMSAILHAKHIKLTIRYVDNLPDILMGDYFRIEYILLGLLSNAIKFTSHGNISISFSKAKQEQDDVLVKIVIKDISAIDNVCLMTNKRFGLGLTFIKQFLEDIGGTFDLDSMQNGGAIFVCLIPFKLTDDV